LLKQAVMKLCGIGLHSNNSVVVITDKTNRVRFSRRCPNDWVKITMLFEPHHAELACVVVESTFNSGRAHIDKSCGPLSAIRVSPQSRQAKRILLMPDACYSISGNARRNPTSLCYHLRWTSPLRGSTQPA
jgi:hypothetical protein